MKMETEQNGTYTLIEEIGQGGFGSVHHVVNNKSGRSEVMKRLHTEYIRDQKMVDLFFAEAAILDQINHPHVVPVYTYGYLDGIPYFTMPYIDGPTLKEGIHTDQHNLQAIFKIVCQTVQEIHDMGIIHCDLKPANILLSKAGPIIIDFGLAYCLGKSTSDGIQGNIISGSPEYMPPEMFQGIRSGPAIDIYALGCLLYEIITHKSLFQRPSLVETIYAHCSPVNLYHANEHVLAFPVEEIIYKALEKEPAARFGSVSELLETLHRLEVFTAES